MTTTKIKITFILTLITLINKNNINIYLSPGTLFKLRNTEIMLSTAYSAVPNFAELWCFSKRMEKIHNNICA